MDAIRSLFRKKRQDQLNGRAGEEVTDKSAERSYELQCQGIRNYSGTCYISVAIQCILAMQATTAAFVSLQNPVATNVSFEFSNRCSMTALVRFFFSERQVPNSMREEELKEYSRNDFHPVDAIANWLHARLPDSSFHPLGEGNCADYTLHCILYHLIIEGYVNGLAEDLCGKYTTRTTCKSCGASYDFDEDSIILLNFSTEREENFDIFQYLKSHEDGIKIKFNGNNNSTGFLTLGNLFYFAQRLTNFSQEDKLCHSKSCECDQVYDVRYRTTVRHFPRTLILDIGCVYCSESLKLYEEFIDLNDHVESQSTSNRKYKLVAVIKETMGGHHVIAYVRASKYPKQVVNSTPGVCDEVQNIWLQMDDENINVVLLSDVFKVKRKERCILLIYEQL